MTTETLKALASSVNFMSGNLDIIGSAVSANRDNRINPIGAAVSALQDQRDSIPEFVVDEVVWKKEFETIDTKQGGNKWKSGGHSEGSTSVRFDDLIHNISGLDDNLAKVNMNNWNPDHPDNRHQEIDYLYRLKVKNPDLYEEYSKMVDMGLNTTGDADGVKHHLIWETLMASFKYVDGHPILSQGQSMAFGEAVTEAAHKAQMDRANRPIFEKVKDEVVAGMNTVGEGFNKFGQDIQDTAKEAVDAIDKAIPSVSDIGSWFSDLLSKFLKDFGIDGSSFLMYAAIGLVGLLLVNSVINKTIKQ